MANPNDAAATLHHTLSTLVTGFELVNVRFFPGFRSIVSPAEMIVEANRAFTQIKRGASKERQNIDEGLEFRTIAEFI